MQKLGWLRDICADVEDEPESRQFLGHPFRVDDWAVATNGHILVAIKIQGDCDYEGDKIGSAKVQKFLALPIGDQVFPLQPLKDWAAHRYDDRDPESSIVHGSAVDRRVVWQALKNIAADTYRLSQHDEHDQPNAMFVFDGDGWRVVLMGLRNTIQTGELPEYTPVELPQETVAAGQGPRAKQPQRTNLKTQGRGV